VENIHATIFPIIGLIQINWGSQRKCQMTHKRQFMSDRLKPGFTIILLFLIMGCAHKAYDTALPQLAGTGQPTLHQVQSATLREKMRSLKVLMFEDIYDELQFDEEGARQARAIGETANAMAVVALSIPDVQQELNLNAEHAQVFRNYAEQLKNQAMDLEEAARLKKSEAYPSLIHGIVKTCNGCHSKFRRM
jgi:hypothetical protein